MRFELGDTMVEGGADTSALADAEITAALEMYPEKWKRAKLALLESIAGDLLMSRIQRPVRYHFLLEKGQSSGEKTMKS